MASKGEPIINKGKIHAKEPSGEIPAQFWKDVKFEISVIDPSVDFKKENSK